MNSEKAELVTLPEGDTFGFFGEPQRLVCVLLHKTKGAASLRTGGRNGPTDRCDFQFKSPMKTRKNPLRPQKQNRNPASAIAILRGGTTERLSDVLHRIKNRRELVQSATTW